MCNVQGFIQNLYKFMQVWVSDSLTLECNATRKVSFLHLIFFYILFCHILVSIMLGVRVGVGAKNRKM